MHVAFLWRPVVHGNPLLSSDGSTGLIGTSSTPTVGPIVVNDMESILIGINRYSRCSSQRKDVLLLLVIATPDLHSLALTAYDLPFTEYVLTSETGHYQSGPSYVMQRYISIPQRDHKSSVSPVPMTVPERRTVAHKSGRKHNL